ncbi:MAG: hypothetical protein RDU13_03985 [Elusimicrobiales bacterium]|nr:hypothetical protein [Elusimicrobiales bacterium]
MKILAAAALALCAVLHAAAPEPEPLKPFAVMDTDLVKEGSTLAASRQWKDVYWTLNDSGSKPNIYALGPDGKMIRPAWVKKYAGISVVGAANVDWEAMTADDKGNLIIGDFGNNMNFRRDLALYVVPEPWPQDAVETHYLAKYLFRYPDMKKFPPERLNFDAESLFFARGSLYIMTKHRGDTFTKLYRFGELKAGETNVPELLGRFDAGDMVTDAEADRDGGRLAVLTYSGAWLFERPAKGDNYFEGKKSFLPFRAGQCEGIAFHGDSLLITNEEREFFRVPLSSFKPR